MGCDSNINHLEELAQEALKTKSAKSYSRRPVVIEFCGSPKSGKTSCLKSLDVFLRRNGFKTYIISEKAENCPITNKHSPVFNLWTVMRSIADLCEMLYDRRHSDIDIILCDRSVCDALCWLEWMRTRGALGDGEFETIANFVTLPFWTRAIDIVFVLTADPSDSIAREYAHLLTRKRGSIMNEKILGSYLDSIQEVTKSWARSFRSVITVDTSGKDQNEVGAEVTQKVLEVLKGLFMEQVGYVESDEYKADESAVDIGCYISRQLPELRLLKFGPRGEVENNPVLKQIVSIAVLTNNEMSKVLMVRKRKEATRDSPEKGAALIWVGGHSREEDLRNSDEQFKDFAANTLKREAEEEVGINVDTSGVDPFVICSLDNPKSRRHLAVCFVIRLDLESTSLHLDGKELSKKRSAGKGWEIVPVESLCNQEKYPLEAWGRAIAKEVFGLEIAPEPKQGVLDFDF